MKTISVSQFKAHLSAELKSVNAGQPILVLEHNRPVAQVLPYSAETQAGVSFPVRSFGFTNYSPLLGIDSLSPLFEDRGRR